MYVQCALHCWLLVNCVWLNASTILHLQQIDGDMIERTNIEKHMSKSSHLQFDDCDCKSEKQPMRLNLTNQIQVLILHHINELSQFCETFVMSNLCERKTTNLGKKTRYTNCILPKDQFVGKWTRLDWLQCQYFWSHNHTKTTNNEWESWKEFNRFSGFS